MLSAASRFAATVLRSPSFRSRNDRLPSMPSLRISSVLLPVDSARAFTRLGMAAMIDCQASELTLPVWIDFE
ncbi:hypothetical protein PAERUG_E15_London_28_01_14_09913 [Pseudomonas aeruginosa]|nr:hypothetical protein PAERUG_E15_London_28_01_14_09913 [Pseudomonas aeruginosa]